MVQSNVNKTKRGVSTDMHSRPKSKSTKPCVWKLRPSDCSIPGRWSLLLSPEKRQWVCAAKKPATHKEYFNVACPTRVTRDLENSFTEMCDFCGSTCLCNPKHTKNDPQKRTRNSRMVRPSSKMNLWWIYAHNFTASTSWGRIIPCFTVAVQAVYPELAFLFVLFLQT